MDIPTCGLQLVDLPSCDIPKPNLWTAMNNAQNVDLPILDLPILDLPNRGPPKFLISNFVDFQLVEVPNYGPCASHIVHTHRLPKS